VEFRILEGDGIHHRQGVVTVGNDAVKKEFIESVRKEIEHAKGTRIWDDYINALKLISQVVFTKSSGFILELVQNAEDAGMGLKEQGIFEIKINKRRIKVIHNGRPFNETDVKALCGIRSSKKPERGTLGYLGIGFKSVFKVTDCPEIYSGGFQFKFDRNHKEWEDPSKTPWHVLPIWIESPSEAVEPEKTTFILPFREEECYPALLQELKNLSTTVYLFLRWLKRIEITDEFSGQSWSLENTGENEEGITTLKHDGHEQKFRFFRRECSVPEWVKQDRLTQEYRANVTRREIVIAFAVDAEGNLVPLQTGVMYGGVSSFLPLSEAKSGARFLIQADFLVQPGREAINYEAKWNYWLMDEICKLCVDAINYFKNHPKWKKQFLPVFEFAKLRGRDEYDKLFGPRLIEPVEKFLENDACVPTAEEGWAKPKEVVKIDESQKAIDDLLAMGLLNKDELATVMGGDPNLKIAAPDVKEANSKPFKKVDRFGLLDNETFLEEKRKSPEAADWFRNLYLWLHAHPRYESTKRGRQYTKGYWNSKIILTSKGELKEGRDVWLPDLQLSDIILKDVAETLQKSKTILHPDVLGKVKNKEDRKTVRGFLTGFTGVQILDNKAVCKEALLPKILTSALKPRPEELIMYTFYCQQIIANEIPKGSEFWILTKRGEVKPAKEVLFPKEFKPEQDWETHQQYVPGISFVSPRYIENVQNNDQLRAWREFFKAGGVKHAPDNGVEVFAENYVEGKLREKGCKNIMRVDKLRLGHDMQAESESGGKMFIEVKGQTHDQDVELTGKEVESADTYQDSFYLCVVSFIPENPTMYVVTNPAKPGIGKKDKLTIPVSIWRTTKWE